MAGIPQNFQSLSNVLPTYNFIDIASGTGYVVLYAGKTVDLNLLSNNSFYSDPDTTSASGGTGGYAKIIDLDFDVLLNRPLNMAGISVLNVPIKLSSVTTTSHAYIVARVRKWDGVTETEIVDNQSSTLDVAGAATTYYMFGIDLNIPLTHFKVGQYLRLTIEVWTNRDGAGSTSLTLAHDPKGRTTNFDTTGAVPSSLIFQLPVRLNL